MRTTDQEIIDMDNFYETATFAEAIAYFKMISNQCIDIAVKAIEKIKELCKGLSRFFIINHGACAGVRRDIQAHQIWLNTKKPDQKTVDILEDIDDRIEMESLLIQAKEILNKQ